MDMSERKDKLRRTAWMIAAAACVYSTAALASHDLTREDATWLNRVTYGISSTTVERYRAEGRRKFLQEQLDGKERLPEAIAQQIQSLEVTHRDGASLLKEVVDEQKRINTLPEGEPRESARKALNDHGNAIANAAARREILRALYSSAQLQEQVVWFWLNHFSVHQAKANGRWLVADYAERAIRPHALGHFSDLVM